MICPYCESLIEEQKNYDNCPNCGVSMGIIRASEMPEPPVGVYKQPFETMEIKMDGIRFYKKFLGIKQERFIPYQDIHSVRYVPGGRELGFLCIREKRDKDRPLISSHKEGFADQTSVVFGSYFNDSYRKIYEFLQKVCRMNR